MNSLALYRAAVVGCGWIGAEELRYQKKLRPVTHAAMFYSSKRIEALALVDRNPTKLKAAKMLFPRTFAFKSLREMMQKFRPDIVSVAVPTHAHEKIVQEVARYRPAAIICEKPLAHTLQGAKRIVEICRAKKILLFVNHTRRFDPNLLKVKGEVKRVGPILQGSAHYVRGLFNNGTHLVDLLRFYLGEVETVCALRNKRTEHWNDLKNDMNVDAFLVFKSGARVAVQSFDAHDQYVFDIVLYSRKGKIPLTERVKGSMAILCSHVIDCIDGKAKPQSTGEDGFAALKILFALKKSAALRGKMVRVS